MNKNPQRRLNETYNIARHGAPKRPTVAKPANGMKPASDVKLHAYLHGQPAVSDGGKRAVPKDFTKKAPAVHPGMQSSPRMDDKLHGKHDAFSANRIFADAANLGQKPEKA